MQVYGYNLGVTRESINEQLRKKLRRCGKTRYRLSMETGISQSVLSRFAAGETELTIVNAEKLCTALGIELVLRTTKGK